MTLRRQIITEIYVKIKNICGHLLHLCPRGALLGLLILLPLND